VVEVVLRVTTDVQVQEKLVVEMVEEEIQDLLVVDQELLM
jgi:hypothetical protein